MTSDDAAAFLNSYVFFDKKGINCTIYPSELTENIEQQRTICSTENYRTFIRILYGLTLLVFLHISILLNEQHIMESHAF